MRTVTLTVGLPGCGKSTWAEQQKSANTIIVNLDSLREMCYGDLTKYKYSKSTEKFVVNSQNNISLLAVQEGKNIIVSDTNLNPNTRHAWEEFAKNNNYKLHIKDFFADFMKLSSYEHEYFAVVKYVELCKRQNLNRLKSVPEHVIDDMAEKYFYAPLKMNVKDDRLEDAIIVDVDGTLAHMNNRSPYDESKVLEDSPDAEVILSVLAEANYLNRKVIIMSGRHETCKADTEAWLKKYNIPYNYIYMRGEGDDRSDDIVKYELFMKHVYGRYNIVKVFDDRQKVVCMWRKLLGLKTFAVEFGNF